MNPVASGTSAWLDIGVLVFREGLECILVLTAIVASMTGASARYRRPVAGGAVVALAATLGTWFLAARVVDDLALNFSALAVQAATGLLAVLVLLVVMNWFFHKIYWTGWIAAHTNRKRSLLDSAAAGGSSSRKVLIGLAMLGFTSLYREGVEVVLFLQSYRMRLGTEPVAWGVALGAALTTAVAIGTFALERRLPYKRMLVWTGVLLGVVLLVMVGEEAQEMQQAGWLSTTGVRWLAPHTPAWMGTWLSVFPTVETLAAQGLAALVVLGSYFSASHARRPPDAPGTFRPVPHLSA